MTPRSQVLQPVVEELLTPALRAMIRHELVSEYSFERSYEHWLQHSLNLQSYEEMVK